MSITNYEYKRDYADAVRREAGQPPWKCSRHANPEQVLSVHNLEVTHVTEPSAEEFSDRTGNLIGTYWGSSGYIWGPGFRAWSKDFPPGTQLVITARAVLPEGYEPPVPPRPPSAIERLAADAVDLDL
ncbi:hypothetical protein A5784_30710 [Mycobacterium sp. 852013-50091_SCH5140682]|uniref:hypothetical protein n=1 Tax=Mycobacterium sp. 852013-50091_SCH5140682 TaxID=1834109 RepID=UPI0007E9868D|nr:hypothetical protein [Mycobacterium sp. 852013-50091_SCH5140682]OBC14076.1 hypothetical protein A5784_30710 [Mycobacterium sp. 852013-50091_SCH5140682]